MSADGKRRSVRNYHIHQPVPLPPKMEDLFASSSSSPSKSAGRSALLLPYRDLGRLETSSGVGTVGGSNESAEASRSTAGSSGYGSGAPTNTTIHQLNQLGGVGEKVLTESYMVRQPQHLDGQSVDSGTLPHKYGELHLPVLSRLISNLTFTSKLRHNCVRLFSIFMVYCRLIKLHLR